MTPLQRMATGGFLACIAFVISGCLELQLQKTYPVLPGPNQMVFGVYNGLNPELNCSMGEFEIHRNSTDELVARLNLDQIHSKTSPVDQGKFYVKEKSIRCSNGTSIYFPRVDFSGPPKVTPVSLYSFNLPDSLQTSGPF